MNQQFYNYIQYNQEQMQKTLNRLPVIFDVDQSLLASGLKEKENETLLEKTRYVVFDNHPNSINKTYGEHAKGSVKLAMNSLLAFFMFIIHAIFPILFNESGTKLLKHNVELSEKSKQLDD